MPLDLEYCFGFKQGKNSVAFYDESTIALTAGNICILHDLNSGLQRISQLDEKEAITAIMRDYSYIIAALKSRPASVCVFQIISERKKLYYGPYRMENQDFVDVSMSNSRRFVAALSGGPDRMLVIWQSNSHEPLVILKPCQGPHSTVNDISFSIRGSDKLVIVGEKVFKQYEYQADAGEGSPSFIQSTFEGYEGRYVYHSIAWPQENLAVGASSGLILFFRGTEFVHKIKVLAKLKHCVKMMDSADCLKIESTQDVMSVRVGSEVLVCLLAGVAIMVYQGEDITQYKFVRYILLPSSDPSKASFTKDFLKNVVINPEGNQLVGVTSGGRLLYCSQIAKASEPQEVSFLIQMQHHEPITTVDIAITRPLIGSCSQHFIILWNYKKRTQELRKHYKEKVRAMALHPSGLFLALGFEELCTTYSILYRDLSEKQLIVFKNCTQLKFSSTGHLLAIMGETNIDIYSFYSQERMFQFDGHLGSITSVGWKVHDSVLVSCDDRGVTCEWNLTLNKLNWEQFAEVPYTSLTTNSAGDIVAVGQNKTVNCMRDGLIKWSAETEKELTSIVFGTKTELFYAGTKDGCIVSLSLPSLVAREVACVHSGEVTAIRMNFDQSIIVSVSRDGLVILTRIASDIEDPTDIYSTLTLVDMSELQNYVSRLKEIDLEIEYMYNMDACEGQVKTVQHEEKVRELVFEWEKKIDTVNERIFLIKKKMQQRLYEGKVEPIETQLEKQLDQEVMDLTAKLGEAYKKTVDYANENTKHLLKYEITIGDLNANHSAFVASEQKYQEESNKRVKDLENELLQKEQEVIDARKELENLTSGEEIELAEKEFSARIVSKPLEVEKTRLTDLKAEIERLKQMIKFRIEDTRKRRNAATGQVDYDIKEKMDAITYLKTEFQKLESTLRVKEKFVQIQEEKFCSTRTLVSALRKKCGVSRTELEELTNHIQSVESQTESCRERVKAIQESIPQIEEELEIITGLCDTVAEKVNETNEGLKQKRKRLRGTQEVLARYTTLLHRCLSREYNLNKLVEEIIKLFDDSRIDFTDEEDDPRLHQEYQFQIEQLIRAYELIKNEPANETKQKAMAEFRLSQENSKILREVHEIQKEDEALRTTLSLMEGSLLLQLGGSRTKGEKPAGEDMRSKIEFVVNFEDKTKFRTIKQLDKFIEEQQMEIARFQTILSAREGSK